MPTRNYAGTAAYFERRAAKAHGARRREHFQSLARLYHEKARAIGERNDGERNNGAAAGAQGSSRRERVAAMFRAFGDSDSIVRSGKPEPSETNPPVD
jgi:hypothetical protein